MSDAIDIEKVKRAIYNVFMHRLRGIIPENQIIWRDQSEPLPKRPCVAMRITSGPDRHGFQDHAGLDSAGILHVGGQRVMVISVQTFGDRRERPRAYQLAKDLNASLSLPSLLGLLRSSGVAVWNQGEVTNLSDLEESEYEERAEFSMKIGVPENQSDDVGWFNTVTPPEGTISQP